MVSQVAEAFQDNFDVLVARPSRIAMIVLGAIVLRWLAKRTIFRFIHSSMLHLGKTGTLLLNRRDPHAKARHDQRAQAIGGLITSIVTFVIAAVAFVMILDVLGINVAPLLTGAGIIGVVIAFGAQTIIKDFISGAYMVLEDQVGVGDEVTMGDAPHGRVEFIGLRVTRLRGDDGTVWYVRNGEVMRLGNHSQGRRDTPANEDTE